MKKFNTDIKYLIILWGLLILAVIRTYAHHGNLIVDCGREAYYPTQILLGKVLYKDLFNIYGPFSYMFNAVLFKIFGINLNVLYLSGCVCAFLISSLIYLIARRFLPEFLSFAIAAFTIITGILNLNPFNFIFPYSYGMLYGTVAALLSLWLLLKYEETSNTQRKSTYTPHPNFWHSCLVPKFFPLPQGAREPMYNIYLYMSGFFAGLCIINKYEFLPYLLVISYAAFKIKPLNLKQYSLLLFSTFFMPIFCFGILFLQGLGVNDIISTVLIINKMSHSQTLNYFYQHKGIFFHKQTIPFLLREFLKTLFPIFLLFNADKLKNKIWGVIVGIFAIWLILYSFNAASFAFLPILISIWFIFNFKSIQNNTKLMILTLSAILLSLKVYWAFIFVSYGLFLTGLLFITILALIFDKFKDKKINPLIISFYIILVSISFCLHSIYAIKVKSSYLATSRGKIYPEMVQVEASDKLIKYIQANTKTTDTVVIFPEGLLINFLTDRKSDNFYNSLIPLYVETFGEDKIIEHFKQKKPEYIIFNNWDNKEYYFRYICNDYALSFCGFVAKNYTQEKVIDDGFRYLIFKLRG